MKALKIALTLLVLLVIGLFGALAHTLRTSTAVTDTNNSSSVVPWITESTTTPPSSNITKPESTGHPSTYTQSSIYLPEITSESTPFPRQSIFNWDSVLSELKNKVSEDFFKLPQLNDKIYNEFKSPIVQQMKREFMSNFDQMHHSGIQFFGKTLKLEISDTDTLPIIRQSYNSLISNSLDSIIKKQKEFTRPNRIHSTIINLDNPIYNERFRSEIFEKFKGIVKNNDHFNLNSSKIIYSGYSSVQFEKTSRYFNITGYSGNGRIRNILNGMTPLNYNQSYLIRFNDFIFGAEDYPYLMKFFLLDSSFQRSFWFCNCHFLDEGLRYLDVGKLASHHSSLFFQNCSMSPIIQQFFMNNEEAPERISVVYNTKIIQTNSNNSHPIESQ